MARIVKAVGIPLEERRYRELLTHRILPHLESYLGGNKERLSGAKRCLERCKDARFWPEMPPLQKKLYLVLCARRGDSELLGLVETLHVRPPAARCVHAVGEGGKSAGS